jgi:hypothetical protein
MAAMAETSVAGTQRVLDEIGAQPAIVVNLTPLFAAEILGTVIARVKGWTDQPAYARTYFGEIQGRADG